MGAALPRGGGVEAVRRAVDMFNTVKALPDGWYLIHVDGCVVDNPKDWITVPDEAMPAVKFIIEEVERDDGKGND